MKTHFFLAIICILLLVKSSSAQNLIAVQNGGTPKFFQQVDDAITNSVDGDTIYIPGGSWNITKSINKRLHIIGVGHHPDSTKLTFPTKIIGNITLASGSSNGSLMGIYLQGAISGLANDVVNSYTITRCRLTGGIYAYPTHSNFTFIQNIIEGQIWGSSGNVQATNCSFYNNIISSNSSVTSRPYMNSIFKNNIFLYNSYWTGSYYFYPISGQFLIFQNNVFFKIVSFSCVTNSTIKNNLLVDPAFSFDNSTNVGYNNIFNQAQSSIFINQTGNSFNYSHDYHLQANSPGKNAGTDGTDVGIYGGIYPWKEGSIPSNPHFQSIQISPKTDSNGNLNVKIKVAAQDR